MYMTKADIDAAAHRERRNSLKESPEGQGLPSEIDYATRTAVMTMIGKTFKHQEKQKGHW